MVETESHSDYQALGVFPPVQMTAVRSKVMFKKKTDQCEEEDAPRLSRSESSESYIGDELFIQL